MITRSTRSQKGTLRLRSRTGNPWRPTREAPEPTNQLSGQCPALAGTKEEETNMEGNIGLLGAGLAALGVIGPGIGIGILTGLSTAAIGRNPDAAAQIRATFIIGAAFAEGLGVLAVVVGLLVIFLG